MEDDLRYQHSFMLAQLGFIDMTTFTVVINNLKTAAVSVEITTRTMSYYLDKLVEKVNESRIHLGIMAITIPTFLA